MIPDKPIISEIFDRDAVPVFRLNNPHVRQTSRIEDARCINRDRALRTIF